jgi:hypothetical protein
MKTLLPCLVGMLPSLLYAQGGSVVRIDGNPETGFRLLRNGEAFAIRGVGGEQYLDVLAASGGNAIRTWGADTPAKQVDGKRLIDHAYELGITVTVGIWLGHERHNFDYTNPEMLERQRKQVDAAVLAFKDHPALLVWGLGNEMEGPTGSGDKAAIWKEINVLAQRIKALDPHHPVMTVVANVNPAKVRAIREHAPAVDILGVNAYAGAAGIGDSLRRLGWDKPYAITEYGLPGPWEAEHTDWKAPIEPTSRRKAGYYFVAHNEIMADTRQCFGAYAFLWGSKQEATASWFGMFLPSGEKEPRVDAMAKAWTGEWPANRAPILGEVDIPFAGKRVAAKQDVRVKVHYRDPEGDPLTFQWEVMHESTDRREGGEAENRPDSVPEAIVSSDHEGNLVLRTPAKAGAYRLFVTVRDGKGSGCMDNWPFYVNP